MTRVRAFICINKHAHMRAHKNVFTLACTHTHTHRRAHTHAPHTHTYTHTHKYAHITRNLRSSKKNPITLRFVTLCTIKGAHICSFPQAQVDLCVLRSFSPSSSFLLCLLHFQLCLFHLLLLPILALLFLLFPFLLHRLSFLVLLRLVVEVVVVAVIV